MKLATWNVNSIRAREPVVVEWIRRNEPDVLCLQETKVVDDDFPTEGLQRLGYEVAMAGQKTYNGVAIAARDALEDVRTGLDGDAHTAERRFLAATIGGLRVASVYVPNGKNVDSPAFRDKLEWLGRLRDTLAAEEPKQGGLVVAGDFNVAREPRDVWSVKLYEGRLHFHPDERRALSRLCDLGLVDAFRLHEQAGEKYSWWDYRGGAFHRNEGLRIDYVFLSEKLAGRCTAAWMDRAARKKTREGVPSDHVPVVVEIA